jgi:hypothetical protein
MGCALAQASLAHTDQSLYALPSPPTRCTNRSLRSSNSKTNCSLALRRQHYYLRFAPSSLNCTLHGNIICRGRLNGYRAIYRGARRWSGHRDDRGVTSPAGGVGGLPLRDV